MEIPELKGSRMTGLSKFRLALAIGAAVVFVVACGGGSDAANSAGDCVPGSDVVGTWKVVANNATLMPDSPELTYFSYNQPSVNEEGLVVFRGRAKNAISGNGEVQRGIYGALACATKMALYAIADTVNTRAPAPNNTDATFNEFPSIPRIDGASKLIATRGQTLPLWNYTDNLGNSTKVGTSGLYVTSPNGLATGIGLLGNVPDFAYMQVPDASTTGLKFDQFPGSPSAAGGRYVVFKGNYTDAVSKTGVFFRDLSISGSPVVAIADSNTVIPSSTVNGNNPNGIKFGSTAPPSAAGENVVFLGLDNEEVPTMGGIYLAPLSHKPQLQPLMQIGDAVPQNLDSTLVAAFTQIGEGLAFDGRYVAFWGAWNTSPANPTGQPGPHMHRVLLSCPADGNQALKAACLAASDPDTNGNPTGITAVDVPDFQGIFIADTKTGVTLMAARSDFTDSSRPFNGFTYWTYSGSTQGGDTEPPRWRTSSFATVDSSRGVLFKGSPHSTTGSSISGIYGVTFTANTLGGLFRVIATGDLMSILDPAAPLGSSITSVSIEREGLRKGWLALTASSADWAGTYVSYFPKAFKLGDVISDQPGIRNLVLGN